MTEAFSPVTFTAGTPIDVDSLNKLQRNLSNVYAQNSSLVNSTTTDIGNIQKEVRTFPVVSIDQVEVIVNGNSKPVTFKNTNFTENPIIVASIASNLATDTSYSVRATTSSKTSANIEVVSTNQKAAGQKVLVNYIAIQMKEIDF